VTESKGNCRLFSVFHFDAAIYTTKRALSGQGGVDTIMICEFCEVIFLRSRQKFAGVLSHGKDF